MGELHKGEGLREIAGAAAARGSFSFDPDELQSLIRKWEDLADSYLASTRTAREMVTIEGPGLDFASEAHAEVANKSGASYAAYLQHNYDYCLKQAELFQAALDDYLGVEDTNLTGLHKTRPDGPRARG